MASGLWIVFWILFAFFACIGPLRDIFWFPFCTFLILMRTTENQMSQNCWVAFWLSFLFVYPSLWVTHDSSGHVFLTVILFTIRYFISSQYEMPTTVFWVLWAFLLLPSLRGPTLGAFVSCAVIIFNCHLESEGIHLPGIRISYFAVGLFLEITLATVIIVTNLVRYPYHTPALLLWFGFIGLLYHQMWPWNEDFGWLWAGAWFLSFHAMIFAFAPFMPVFWYVLWAGIVVGLGFAFRPDHSLLGLYAWDVTILALRAIFFVAYVLYYLNSMTADLFPFLYFSHKWRMSSPRWFPLSSRNHDSLNYKALCKRCDHFTTNSKLIMGSSSYLTRLVEWHDFWSREEFISQFKKDEPDQETIDQASAFPEPSCRLCCLLWYSLSPRRQQALIVSTAPNENNARLEGFDFPAAQNPNAELRVKVWQERPLSLYTYAQLFWGEVALGARLLIHRDNHFATASPATKCDKTNSERHFEQAKIWLKMCRENHKFCHGVGNTKPKLPTRMLYVSSGPNWAPGMPPETLRLIQSKQIDSKVEYLALSHCWGPTAEMRFKLLASNIDACYESIDFTGLSQNMQDAITTTLSLGFSYIWIDSLCIIQRDDKRKKDDKRKEDGKRKKHSETEDSETEDDETEDDETEDSGTDSEIEEIETEDDETAEPWRKDWKTEAKKMGSVYSAATLTIASTASSTSSGGCFHSRSLTNLKPCKIGVSSPDTLCPDWIYARQDDVFDFERSVDLAPLNTRGWVMQERLLSRRILHFGANMIYWECCGRSASELNPHGYSYKKFPDDFKDYYVPEMNSSISNRESMQAAERLGNGISWATAEDARKRPPPVGLDPDAPPDSQVVWQQKRGFWKNVLKPNSAAWSTDNSNNQSQAGFRAAFEQLRAGPPETPAHSTESLVGRESPSQMWYDVVELYSRGKLTSPGDKLMALKGIENEIARARKLTYMHGLWKEQLLTDLLWFAIEGPGQRLRSMDVRDLMVPIWSWASIEGVVALDLLPETSLETIGDVEQLVTIGPERRFDSLEMLIRLTGPLLPISAPTFDGISMWSIDIGQTGVASARLFPDVKEPDICQMSDLACIAFLVLNRTKKSLISSSDEDIQGLVVRLLKAADEEGGAAVYQRVGYFTTSYISRSRIASKGRKALKKAPLTKVCLAG